MTAAILSIVAGLVTALVWYLNNSPRRRRATLLRQIQEVKDALAKALAAGDVDGVARCNLRLRELQETVGRLPARK